jgi:hypothetical protein
MVSRINRAFYQATVPVIPELCGGLTVLLRKVAGPTEVQIKKDRIKRIEPHGRAYRVDGLVRPAHECQRVGEERVAPSGRHHTLDEAFACRRHLQFSGPQGYRFKLGAPPPRLVGQGLEIGFG